MKYLLLLMFLVGCESDDTKYRCIDGDIYREGNGALIEVLTYKSSKCKSYDN